VNGALAGLVAITAPCAWVGVTSSAIIGLVGGLLVVPAVLFFDRIRVDDPVGALSVHLVNGIWGTLAVGLFADPDLLGYGDLGPLKGLFVGGTAEQLTKQLIGVGAVAGFTLVGSLIVWTVIKVVFGLRAHTQDEVVGLDVSEMGMEAYSGFQVSDPHEHVAPTAEPRAASVPPGGTKRFNVVVEGVPQGDLIKVWSSLCQPSQTPPPAEFRAVYPYLTTVQGNTFRFRGGTPEEIRGNLERLLQTRVNGHSVRVRVEKS
jgi:Amt family ammonium transporter